MATMTRGFDVQNGVSYFCYTVTVAPKSTVFELRTWDRRTDGRKHSSFAWCPHFGGGKSQKPVGSSRLEEDGRDCWGQGRNHVFKVVGSNSLV